MQYRHLYPMVRILLPFMAGIIVCISLSSDQIIPVIFWILLLLLTVGAEFLPAIKKSSVKKWFFGVMLSSFLFVSGYNSVLLHMENLRPGHFRFIQTKGVFVAMVAEPIQEKDHSYKTILRVTGLKKGNTILKAEGHILTYFAKDSTLKPPTEGSLIVFSGDIQKISPPQNPGGFDYRKYMANNNVYHQVYLNNISWKILENPHGFSITRIAHEVSRKFVSILSNNGLKGQEFAVASALILGQNDMLDNETLQAYSGSGVTHILSVSGLHVGVIFIVINFLLGFMKKEGRQLFIKTFLILLTIWAYALLTGMSPPVMRSAAMFTFISLGNASKRNVHIINSLSVSAFMLLLINPLMISNIGFQLSYLAIVGIVFINKPIADLWNPKNKIGNEIWGLIAVSLAAQIATAPLTMLYFHQFPAYFIPANLVAIPLSFLAIYAGLSVLVTSAIPLISNFLGLVTNFLLFCLNYSVSFIEHLPHSVLKITSIFTREMILLYLILISIILLFTFKKKAMIYISLCFILLVSASFTQTELKRQRQQKIIFYSTGKQSSVGFINGRQQILMADSALLKDKKASKFQLDGAKYLYGTSVTKAVALDTITSFFQQLPPEFYPLRSLGNNFLYRDKRIAIIDSIPKRVGECKKLSVDFLVIRNNPKLRINDLKQLYLPGIIIIDGSNSFYKTDKWMTDSQKAGLKAYSIKKQGAFVVDL
ncbi:MAG: ComEC/Rec2 family competence protein [Bacteroidota bacterium]